ncbi:SPOR domain-containing protein, partial [Desulfovibrio sp.]|uniref:SPOR domain-containing protein n=1 Tax=Desulfovibrio sp. TaxID=885 RepID=UPI0023D363ED
RRTLDLSGAAATALGLALACAVGWAFFMGYLVGRGEHPRRGVESVAGLILPQGPGGAPGRRAPLPGEEALPPARQGGGPAVAPEAAPEPPGGAQASAAPDAPPAAQGPSPAPAPEPVAEAAAAQPSAPAYPFTRPQGEGLAAWGITPEAAPQAAPANPQAATTRQPGREAPARATQAAPTKPAQPARPAEPRFDYVFQAAAFKGPVDAERLRGRLEAAGLRAKVRPSGKVRLVVVSLRGSAEDARRVRGTLAGMGLGRPILLEKSPVTEKAGGKGRRRSAP